MNEVIEKNILDWNKFFQSHNQVFKIFYHIFLVFLRISSICLKTITSKFNFHTLLKIYTTKITPKFNKRMWSFKVIQLSLRFIKWFILYSYLFAPRVGWEDIITFIFYLESSLSHQLQRIYNTQAVETREQGEQKNRENAKSLKKN